jgi:lysyl-tRNA synthetase class 2
VYVDKARLEANQPGGFASLKNLFDIGDIIGARGSVKRTEKGELSVVASELQVLTKSLLPLPDKWHGLADVEKRYRCGVSSVPGRAGAAQHCLATCCSWRLEQS